MPKHYAHRDTQALGDFYTHHVEAMTAERLHSKSDIAAELAYRDQQIAALEAELCLDTRGEVAYRVFMRSALMGQKLP